MKRVSSYLTTLLFLFVIVVGCNNSGAVIEEVNLQRINNDARLFIEKNKDVNGLHLYSQVGERQYLIIKYSTVLQGEEAKFLNTIKAKIVDKVLIINIEELGTNDYQDKRLKSIRVFNLKNIQEFEKIQIYKNGKETSFNLVGG